MTKENITEYILLGLLSHEDLSGYDLKKRIDVSISNFWEVGYGQIYPTLKRLQAEGSITGSEVESEKGPDRIVYAITPAGSEKLSAWLTLEENKEYVKYEILIKVFFGYMLPKQETIERIEAFKQSNLARSQQMMKYTDVLKNLIDEDEDHLYFYLTALFGQFTYQASVRWAEEAISLLQQKGNEK